MDLHARKILQERFHTVILFHDLHISQIFKHMHTLRNKHSFKKHLICWKLHTCRHGAAALYSEPAWSLDITHFWEQKPDTLLRFLLAYFCFCFSSAIKLNSLACSLGNNLLEFTAAIMPFFLERWPPLCRCGESVVDFLQPLFLLLMITIHCSVLSCLLMSFSDSEFVRIINLEQIDYLLNEKYDNIH